MYNFLHRPNNIKNFYFANILFIVNYQTFQFFYREYLTEKNYTNLYSLHS